MTISYEEFQKLAKNFLDESTSEDVSCIENTLCIEIRKNYPQFLQNNPHLKLITNLKGHTLRSAEELNNLMAGKPPLNGGDYSELEASLVRSILFSMFYKLENQDSSSQAEYLKECFESLVLFLEKFCLPPNKTCYSEKIKSSFISAVSLISNTSKCSECGKSLRLVLDFNEEDLLFAEVAEFKDFSFQAPGACEESKGNQVIEVCFPSGKVYAADWFRLEGNLFTKILKDKELIEDYSSRKGLLDITKRSAETHNFVKIQVGNTCPHVFSSDTEILIGCFDEEAISADSKNTVENNGFKNQGYICTDLWAACLIDHETLADLLKKEGCLDPEKLIADMLQSSYTVNSFQVKPGIYEMNTNGYYTDFEKNYEGWKPSDLTLFATLKLKEKI